MAETPYFLVTLRSCWFHTVLSHGLLAICVHLKVSTVLGACCRAWPKVLFNLHFFLHLEEISELLHWPGGASCFVFYVYLSVFFILARESATEVAQTCETCSVARPSTRGYFLSWGIGCSSLAQPRPPPRPQLSQVRVGTMTSFSTTSQTSFSTTSQTSIENY